MEEHTNWKSRMEKYAQQGTYVHGDKQGNMDNKEEN